MTVARYRFGTVLAGALALLAILALAAPAAEAKKKAKLDGQLIAAATTKGSKVEAPILLSQKTAKKLKLGSPVATLRTKASKKLSAPNPTGQGTIAISPEALRAGDELKGKAKVKGKRDALIPKLKGKKLEVVDRESAFSVDELTAAVVALYQQVEALGLRVINLETSLTQLRVELEELKAKDASLQGQVNSLLGQITNLEAALASLTSVVGGLPTQAQLDAVIDSITALEADLEGQIDALGIGDIDGLQSGLDDLQSQITGLDTMIDSICGELIVVC